MSVDELINQVNAATERIAQSNGKVQVIMSIRSSIRSGSLDTSIQVTVHTPSRSTEEWFSVLDLTHCKVPVSDRICMMVDRVAKRER